MGVLFLTEKVYLNTTLSKELSRKGEYTPKYCYDNIFENIGLIGSRFQEEDIKIMFCYVSVLDSTNLYTRHACYYLDGEAIDPTIVNAYKDNTERYNVSYLPIMIMSVNEYLKLISKEKRTDLFKTLRKVEEVKQKKLVEKGVVFIG